jgi:hypothetical protein
MTALQTRDAKDRVEAALAKFLGTFPTTTLSWRITRARAKPSFAEGPYRWTPNGPRAQLPVFIHFEFKNDLIARELFFFDPSALCAQSGVSTDAVRRKLFGETTPSAVAAARIRSPG